MIVHELLALPPWIKYQGISFEFRIINDGGKELRLVYAISSVDENSPHYKCVTENHSWRNNLADVDNPPMEAFLILFENITSDADMIYSIRCCGNRLWDWGLM